MILLFLSLEIISQGEEDWEKRYRIWGLEIGKDRSLGQGFLASGPLTPVPNLT